MCWELGYFTLKVLQLRTGRVIVERVQRVQKLQRVEKVQRFNRVKTVEG